MKRKNKKNFFLWAGGLLILAALSLTGYNLYMDYEAGERSVAVLDSIHQKMSESDISEAKYERNRKSEDQDVTKQQILEKKTSEKDVSEKEFFETEKQEKEKSASQKDKKKEKKKIGKKDKKDKKKKKSTKDIPPYELNPDMEMPVIEEEGRNYIGVLSIPKFELELPILETWGYPELRIAPCRYKGTIYRNDIIIAAHNYTRHFGSLHEIELKDEVLFTDAKGNVFHYEVSKIETLDGTAVEEMESGEWDMTLFTCTYGGKSRVTVRCERIEQQSHKKE